MRKITLEESQLQFMNLLLSTVRKDGDKKNISLERLKFYKHKEEPDNLFINTELISPSKINVGWFCFLEDTSVYDLLDRFPEQEDLEWFTQQLYEVSISEMIPKSKVNEIEAFVSDQYKIDFDKGGQPYIDHLKRVATKQTSNKAKIVALLHDLLEDKAIWNIDKLRDKFDLSKDVLDAVDCITHKRNDSYCSYIKRVLTNKVARKVKISDIEDNLDIKRLEYISSKDIVRLNKYLLSNRILNSNNEKNQTDLLNELETYN